MNRTALRSGVAALAVLAAVAAPSAGAATAPLPTVRYVLTVARSFNASSLPGGVVVEKQLGSVRSLIVRAPLGAVSWLVDVPGVIGVSPDRPLHVTSDDAPSSHGVYAPSQLGDAAGAGDAGQGVKVALLDTGVADSALLTRSGHHLVRGPNFSGDDSPARDGYGHGTFMANLIAGGSAGERAVGIAPAATVVDVKVADSSGRTTLSQVLSGFDWVVKHAGDGIRVLSLSLSATRPQDGFGRDPLTEGADAVRNAGVVVVVAAGVGRGL